jgi:hypothetical protein
MDIFAPFVSNPLTFTVQNITSGNRAKTIRLFQYPINSLGIRDLLKIPGVAESDIRASLLKGELRNRIINNEIVVVASDIDLLQFNDINLAFLTAAGITNGTTVSGGDGYGITEAQHKTLRDLIHFIDSGGGDGFTSGAERVILPEGDPFPTTVIWYLDSTLTTKLVQKDIVYNPNKTVATIQWTMYDYDGITIIHQILDTISYTNNIFESTRIRTIVI